MPAITKEASGPSYSVRRLCDALAAQGDQVTLAALDWGPISSPPTYLKTFPLGRGPSRLGLSPAMHRWLKGLVGLGEVSLIHNHGMWQVNSLYPAWATSGGGVQLVYSPRGALSTWAMNHGSWAKGLFWPLLQRPALQRATCFHATAEAEYLDIRRLGFSQPVAIIPNGIDVPAQVPHMPATQRTLLFLGRVHVVKGLDMLLSAWREVQDKFPDWRLVIAGGDDGYNGVSGYLAELKALAKQQGLKRVEFPGPIYGEHKMNAFRDADLYVLPSRSENFAMTVAEALAVGTPALVSKGAPWSGLVRMGAGWWVDVGAVPLAVCLNDALARTPTELAAMGERGRAWMQEDFSWNGVGEKMSATYRWLCDRSLPVPSWVRLD